MFLMSLDVTVEICCLTVFSFYKRTYKILLYLYDLMMAQVVAETSRHLVKIFIKVCWLRLENFRLLYYFMKSAHSLCTGTVSTVDIKEELTVTAVTNRLNGAECFWRS